LARAIRVETVTLRAETFEDIIKATGSVEAVNDASLSARSAGTVVTLLPLGTRVGAGTAVAKVDPGLVQAGLDQAKAQAELTQAQLSLAEDSFARQEPLHRDSIISPIEFEQVKAQVAQAKAQHAQASALVNQAEEQLRQTMITSPFAGSVEEHFIEEGEQVAPGTPVARVVNTTRVKVVAGIPERYAGDIRKGTGVRLTFSSYGVPERTANVSFVGNAIDTGSRTIPIEVVVDNADGLLKPAMIADLFVTRNTHEAVIVVPQSAILRDEGGNSVYVVDRSGQRPTAKRRVVELGNTNSGRVQVISGLEVGDELITVGANSVAPGDAVEVAVGDSITEAL
jgi:membrane fusion protein (multidrug efflux system)